MRSQLARPERDRIGGGSMTSCYPSLLDRASIFSSFSSSAAIWRAFPSADVELNSSVALIPVMSEVPQLAMC